VSGTTRTQPIQPLVPAPVGRDRQTPDHESAPSATPQWLLQGELAMCPCGCIGKRRKGSFVEKTLTGSAGLLRQVMFSEDVAAQRGLLQRIDPRVKLVGLLVLLVATGLVHHVWVLVAVYAATLLLAAASGLPVGFFVKRVWLFVPIFTGIVVLPATLSIVTPGDVVLQLWSWHGSPQGFTAQGLTSAALVVSRVATSISLVVLLTLTTPWVRLLAALRALGVPRIFVLVIGMAYRYVFLLLGTVTDMYEARKARTVGAQGHDGSARAFVSASAGALFGKAHHLSEEVHQAMLARGYRGDARTLKPFSFAARDAVAAAAVVAAAVVIYGGDLFLGH
jgi:cobalt ECF transporter T component CbiQ